MEIGSSRRAVIIEDEKFNGRELYIRGELFIGGFYVFETDSARWLEFDPERNMKVGTLVDEKEKSEIMAYVKEEAEKKDFRFIFHGMDFRRRIE